LKNHAEITNTDEVLGKVTGENISCYVKKNSSYPVFEISELTVK